MGWTGKSAPSQDPLLGQVVGGRYEVIRQIGKGGMGAIYEVRNTRLGRAFALKTLFGEAAADPESRARFRREADAIARIKHPHIVDIIDWEELEDGSPCLILEYLQGEDLGSRIGEAGPMPWPFIAKIGDQVLSALAVAHAAGIIHRDLKPQNIFLSMDDSGEERVKLLDFGVSKMRDSQSLVTTDARLLGTPAYMSPEQAEGRIDDVGPHTDLWAMGAILYEMATGELAFDGPSMPAMLYKICSKDALSVSTLRPEAPVAFTELVRDALVREIDGRIPDAFSLRARLRSALQDVAHVRYTDPNIMTPPSRPTPQAQTTPGGRRKRFTGAIEDTVMSGKIPVAAETPVVRARAPMDTPVAPSVIMSVGQISTNTLAPPARRLGLIVGMASVIGAMAVIVVVLAMKGPKDVDRPPAAPVQPARLVVPAPPPAPDAAIIAPPEVTIDAAVEAPVKKRPVTVKKPPPKKIEPVAPPKVDPPKVDPPKAKCDKAKLTAEQYALCLHGDGT
jgi:serine/threonine protein kinase